MEGAGTLAGVRVLVVGDDDDARALLARMLELDGMSVSSARTAAEARRSIEQSLPAVALIDLELPGEDGLGLVESLSRSYPALGCIIVSARGEEASRVLGLRLGADDYVVKPFSSAELVARIDALVRRTRAPAVQRRSIERGDLRIDLDTHEVHLRGEAVHLTAREYALLAFLATSPRQVFTREQLLEHVWSSSTAWQDTATVTEHVRRLRRKLDVDGDRPLIETVRGVGYRFTG